LFASLPKLNLAINYDIHLSKKIEESHARAKSNIFESEMNREKADIKNSHNTISDNLTNFTDNQNSIYEINSVRD